MDPHESASANGILITWAVFAQHIHVINRQTDTQTDRQTERQTDTLTDRQTTLRATSIATGHIYALHAGDMALKCMNYHHYITVYMYRRKS